MIFAITSKNIEDVCTPLAWEGEQPVAISGHSCAYATESIIPRYLAYLATAQDSQISKRKVAKGTKVIEAAPVDLSRVEILAPSIGIQQKVVDILDRFDTLTKSLADGIPAEIGVRRAQYGYYRDRLLGFPRKAIGIEWSDGSRAAAKGLPTFVTVANSSRAIWAVRRKIAGLNREAPSIVPQTLCIIIKGRARASAFAETQPEARISLFRAASASCMS